MKLAAAHKLQGRIKLWGLDISIENRKGSIRRWYDPNGKEKGHTKMHWDYGYAQGTKGTDGDCVDIYIGPNPESRSVFVINQMKKPDGAIQKDGKPWTGFDEQKAMLGWLTAEDAKAAYLKQYDDPRFFGSMRGMDIDEFRAKALDPDNHGKKVAGAPVPFRSKAQQKAAFAGAIPGIDKEKAREWAHKTKNLKALPEHVKKSSLRLAELNFARAQEGQPAVKIAVDKVEHTANHVDDVGIGLLAAPYAAELTGKALERTRLRGAGTALRKTLGTDSGFGHSHARELAGLALVAPGVTHRVAKGINKLSPEKTAALHELLGKYIPDFEYYTEAERTATTKSWEKLAGVVSAATEGAAALASRGTRAIRLAATPIPRATPLHIRTPAPAPQAIPRAARPAATPPPPLPAGSTAVVSRPGATTTRATAVPVTARPATTNTGASTPTSSISSGPALAGVNPSYANATRVSSPARRAGLGNRAPTQALVSRPAPPPQVQSRPAMTPARPVAAPVTTPAAVAQTPVFGAGAPVPLTGRAALPPRAAPAMTPAEIGRDLPVRKITAPPAQNMTPVGQAGPKPAAAAAAEAKKKGLTWGKAGLIGAGVLSAGALVGTGMVASNLAGQQHGAYAAPTVGGQGAATSWGP